MIKKKSRRSRRRYSPNLKNTIQIRLYPTSAQAKMLREHCAEYIDCVNVIVQAHDADMLPKGFSTKDFTAPLPSAVKNQVIRDAQSVYSRSYALGRIPHLKKPFAQWNNQNWKTQMSETRSHKREGSKEYSSSPCGTGPKRSRLRSSAVEKCQWVKRAFYGSSARMRSGWPTQRQRYQTYNHRRTKLSWA